MKSPHVRVLAVGAHPDDVELGCGATLSLFERSGHETYVLVLTNGEASGDPKLRKIECGKSCSRLSVKKVFFGGLQDTKITDGLETILTIEDTMKKIRPDIIFAHSSKDGHQDHRNAGLACLSAARNAKKVLLYESPAAQRDFCPQVFVDVTSTFHAKLEALREYGSQASKVYFKGESTPLGPEYGSQASKVYFKGESTPLGHARIKRERNEDRKFPYVSNAVEGLARFRGFQAGVKFAEAFEVGKYIMDI